MFSSFAEKRRENKLNLTATSIPVMSLQIFMIWRRSKPSLTDYINSKTIWKQSNFKTNSSHDVYTSATFQKLLPLLSDL